jgi:hypothetical protein
MLIGVRESPLLGRSGGNAAVDPGMKAAAHW